MCTDSAGPTDLGRRISARRSCWYWMRSAYAYVFYCARWTATLTQKARDGRVDDWLAFGIVALVESVATSGFVFFMHLVRPGMFGTGGSAGFGVFFDHPRAWFLAISAGWSALNYIVLLRSGAYASSVREFATFSRSKHRALRVIVLGAGLICITVTFWLRYLVFRR